MQGQNGIREIHIKWLQHIVRNWPGLAGLTTAMDTTRGRIIVSSSVYRLGFIVVPVSSTRSSSNRGGTRPCMRFRANIGGRTLAVRPYPYWGASPFATEHALGPRGRLSACQVDRARCRTYNDLGCHPGPSPYPSRRCCRSCR